MQPFLIRQARVEDLPAILDIFNALIAGSTAVYTEAPVDLDERLSWFRSRTEAGFPVLVAEAAHGQWVDERRAILGYASFGPFRGNWPGYRHTVEHSVHVHQAYQGRGVGSALIKALFPIAQSMGVHVMVGAIDADNAGSRRLHQRLGFVQTGLLPEVGRKFGRWRDLVFMQRVLPEKPSSLPSEKPTSAHPAAEQTLLPTPFGNIHLKYWPSRLRQPNMLPVVVLLHGMFGDVNVWSATALSLVRSGLNVLALDLPGHGYSSASVETVSQAVSALDAALRAICPDMVAGLPASIARLQPPWLFVGHSFGGLLAAELAALCDRRAELAGLVLLAPSGLGEEVNRDFLLSVLEASDEQTLADALSRLTVRRYRSAPAALRAMWSRLSSARPQLYQLMDSIVDVTGRQSHSITGTLSGLSVPLSLIHGREDAIIPWQQALNAPPGTALYLLPGIGHMPHWEATDLTSRVIARAALVQT